MFPRPHVPLIDIVDNDNITKGPMLPNSGAICSNSLFSQILGSSVFKASCSQGPMFLIRWVLCSQGPMFPGSRFLCSQGPKLLRVYIVDNGNIPKGPMFPNSWDLWSLGPKFLSSRVVCSEGSKFQGPMFPGLQGLGNHLESQTHKENHKDIHNLRGKIKLNWEHTAPGVEVCSRHEK